MTRRVAIWVLAALLISFMGMPAYAQTNVSGVNTPFGSNLPLNLGSNQSVLMIIEPNGFVGIGTLNPQNTLDVQGTVSGLTSSAAIGGVQGTATGTANGVWGYAANGDGVMGQASGTGNGVNGTSASGWGGYFTGADGVYGQTAAANSQGVQGTATGAGSNGVLGTSTQSWAGNFQGFGGVYSVSNGAQWAGYFWPQNSQTGVYIDNPSHNAMLCLNGTSGSHCSTTIGGSVTTATSMVVSGSVIVGTWQFCADGGNGELAGIYPVGGSPGAYVWEAIVRPGFNERINCF